MDEESLKTSIDDGNLYVFLDGEWQLVGPVKLTRYANAALLTIDTSSPDGKEMAALLDSISYYKKRAEGVYLLKYAATDQHNPANEIPEGVQQVGNNLEITKENN